MNIKNIPNTNVHTLDHTQTLGNVSQIPPVIPPIGGITHLNPGGTGGLTINNNGTYNVVEILPLPEGGRLIVERNGLNAHEVIAYQNQNFQRALPGTDNPADRVLNRFSDNLAENLPSIGQGSPEIVTIEQGNNYLDTIVNFFDPILAQQIETQIRLNIAVNPQAENIANVFTQYHQIFRHGVTHMRDLAVNQQAIIDAIRLQHWRLGHIQHDLYTYNAHTREITIQLEALPDYIPNLTNIFYLMGQDFINQILAMTQNFNGIHMGV